MIYLTVTPQIDGPGRLGPAVAITTRADRSGHSLPIKSGHQFRRVRRLALSAYEFGHESSGLGLIDTPLEVCIARDPKGIYRRALDSQIENFTGVQQAYEPPAHPEIHLMAAQDSAEDLTPIIIGRA